MISKVSARPFERSDGGRIIDVDPRTKFLSAEFPIYLVRFEVKMGVSQFRDDGSVASARHAHVRAMIQAFTLSPGEKDLLIRLRPKISWFTKYMKEIFLNFQPSFELAKLL